MNTRTTGRFAIADRFPALAAVIQRLNKSILEGRDNGASKELAELSVLLERYRATEGMPLPEGPK